MKYVQLTIWVDLETGEIVPPIERKNYTIVRKSSKERKHILKTNTVIFKHIFECRRHLKQLELW